VRLIGLTIRALLQIGFLNGSRLSDPGEVPTLDRRIAVHRIIT